MTVQNIVTSLGLWILIVGIGTCMIISIVHYVYQIYKEIYHAYKEVVDPPKELMNKRSVNYEIICNYFHNNGDSMEDSNISKDISNSAE